MEPTSGAQAQELVEFIFMCTVFLGGPIGIVYSIMETKLLTWLKQEAYIKGLLISVAGVLCVGFAKIIGSDLSLYEISSAVPGILGGISAFKTSGNYVVDKVQAMRATNSGQDINAGDPPISG